MEKNITVLLEFLNSKFPFTMKRDLFLGPVKILFSDR